MEDMDNGVAVSSSFPSHSPLPAITNASAGRSLLCVRGLLASHVEIRPINC
jgi:hypothetical protein